MRWVLRVITVALMLAAGIGQAQMAPKRVALIVANANYIGYQALPNTATDAGLVYETLARAGFSSIVLKADQGVAEFRATLRAFGRAADDADVALLYYAGHGIEATGRNWLIPVDAHLAGEADLAAQGIDVADVFAAMAGARTRVAVLDACRSNPYEARLRESGSRTVGRGLGAPTGATGLSAPTRAGETGQGTLLMYSAAPGANASDGPAGQGSPFARAFQKYFAAPDAELLAAAGNIAHAVLIETGSSQQPFLTSSLFGQPIVLARTPPPPAPKSRPGDTFRECAGCPEMVVVPAGRILLGSPSTEAGRAASENQTPVVMENPFAVGKFEVTFDDWDACVADGGCRTNPNPNSSGWGRGRRPVINVSWPEANEYASWLSQKTRARYRLLTGAEWEYAARGGVLGPFYNAADASQLCAIANHADGSSKFAWRNSTCTDDYGERTAEAGSFAPNAFGLFDMLGNVEEWVEDCADPQCETRGLRGGSWFSAPTRVRVAARSWSLQALSSDKIGFRVARLNGDR